MIVEDTTVMYGNYFPPYARPVGVGMFLVGALFVVEINLAIGLVLCITILVMVFAKAGMTVNLMKKEYMDFYFLFGLKKGNWSSYQQFDFITVKKTTEATDGDPTFFASLPVYSKSDFYDIYLYDDSYRVKRKVWRKNRKEDALKLAETLSAEMGLDVKAYAPPVSRKSRERRGR